MSFVRARRLTDTCTVWPAIGGQFPSWGDPYKLPCNFIKGGKEQRDADGEQFQPDATFRLQFATPDDVTLSRGDVILNGDWSAKNEGGFFVHPNPADTNQPTANKIRKVKEGTMLTGNYDVTVYTG